MKYCPEVGRHQLIYEPPLSPPLQEAGDKEVHVLGEEKAKEGRGHTGSCSSTTVSREAQVTPVQKFGIIC